jgi:ATP phosphoribosyltransferase
MVTLSGAVELAPNLGLASAIIEITDTGTSLLLHDLVVVHEIMHSEAILIGNNDCCVSRLSKPVTFVS